MGAKKDQQEQWEQPDLFDRTLEGLREDLLTMPKEQPPESVLPELVRWGIYRSVHEAKRDWLDSTRECEEGVLRPPSISFPEYLQSLRTYHLELIELVLSGELPDIATARQHLRQKLLRSLRARKSS